MAVLRNVSPLGGLHVPLIRQNVDGGAEFTVTAEQASRLLEQADNFAAVDEEAKTIAATIADALIEAAVSAEPSPVLVPASALIFDPPQRIPVDAASAPDALEAPTV